MKLQIKDDSGKTTVVPITRDEITIGRKEGNTIRLTERNVSRTHARFLKKGEEIHIEDVSRYGTRVNGERITQTRQVGAGDTIQIGDYLLSLEGVKAVEQVIDERLAAAGADAAEQTMTEFRGNEQRRAEVEAAARDQIAAAKAEMQADQEESRKNKKKKSKDPSALEVTGEITAEELQKGRSSKKKRKGASHPTLVAVTTHLAGSEYPITGGTMVLGRTGENDIKVDHHSISRNHAKVVVKNGKVRMVDLQSKNGIRVNGEFWEESSLKSGDIVELGKVQFRYVEKGEEFVYRPEDFAAVEVVDDKKKGGRGFLVVLLLLAAGGLAAVYFLVIAKPSDKSNVTNVPVATGQPTTKPATTTAPATKPTAAVEPDVTVAPDTTAVAEKDTAAPPPVDNTAKIKEHLDKAQAAAKAQKWDEAEAELEALRALDPEHAEAAALGAKVTSEKKVEAAFNKAREAQAKDDLQAAWAALQELSAMPADSSYAAQVKELKKAVGSALANGLVDEAKKAMRAKRWETAIDKAQEAIKVMPNHPEAPTLLGKAKREWQEQRRKELAEKEKENQPPPEKADNKTPEALYKEARALHSKDKAAALELYEQAAAKGYHKAYKFIGIIKIGSGEKQAAIQAYQAYLKHLPNARDAETVRDTLKLLGVENP